jgi:hypothetical protein
MTLEDLEQRIIKLSAQHLIMRDFIAWLLAREAGAALDPSVVIRLVSEFGDRRIDGIETDSVSDLQIAEILREEKDWVVAAATRLLNPDKA